MPAEVLGVAETQHLLANGTVELFPEAPPGTVVAPEGSGEARPQPVSGKGQRRQLPLAVALLFAVGVAWPSCSCPYLRRDLSFL